MVFLRVYEPGKILGFLPTAQTLISAKLRVPPFANKMSIPLCTISLHTHIPHSRSILSSSWCNTALSGVLKIRRKTFHLKM